MSSSPSAKAHNHKVLQEVKYLIDREGKSLLETVAQSSKEQLSPVLMTALTTGLALAADRPGSEIQSPMSIIILGGLLAAIFLNQIVALVLFLKWRGGRNLSDNRYTLDYPQDLEIHRPLCVGTKGPYLPTHRKVK